jgi:SAM-dependent methyltransferase
MRLIKKNVPIPPKQLRFMEKTEEDFLRNGDTIRDDLRAVAGLEPSSFVFDVGSGYGRLAHALIRWRGREGRYLGMDILPKHVAWCQAHLGGGSIRFEQMDVQNDRYNPKGKKTPTEVEFAPLNADVVVLTSVFTHMWPDDIVHYLKQIRIALANDGTAYLTFFLRNASQAQSEQEGRSEFPLRQEVSSFCSIHDPENPLHVIAYDEDWVLQQIEDTGLSCSQPPLLGSWCGRQSDRFQDVLVVTRAP